jgi:hypothetical protein
MLTNFPICLLLIDGTIQPYNPADDIPAPFREKFQSSLLDQHGRSSHQHAGRSRTHPSCRLLGFSSRCTIGTYVDDTGALGCDNLVDPLYGGVEYLAVRIQALSPPTMLSIGAWFSRLVCMLPAHFNSEKWQDLNLFCQSPISSSTLPWLHGFWCSPACS